VTSAVLTQAALPVKLVDTGINWPAWIAAISSLLTLGIVAYTAWVAYGALEDARQTRHGQLITEISRQWSEPAAVESIRLHPEWSAETLADLVERLFGPADEKRTDERDWSRLVPERLA
jgi:hypothetical protein